MFAPDVCVAMCKRAGKTNAEIWSPRGCGEGGGLPVSCLIDILLLHSLAGSCIIHD